MRRIVIYMLLAILMLQQTELCQLGKLPLLFGHYREHCDQDTRISFVRFLEMHYWGKDISDHDEDKDMRLPFKKCAPHRISVSGLPVSASIGLRAKESLRSPDLPSYRTFFRADPALKTPFRPPCSCSFSAC